MSKKNKRNIIILGSIFVLAVILEVLAPEKLDWVPYYESSKKTPYSCSVTLDILYDIFPNQEIEQTNESFYMFYRSDSNLTNTNYLLITNYLNPEPLDFGKMLTFVKKGNTMFIAANEYSDNVLDTFKLDIGYRFIDTTLIPYKENHLKFLNPELSDYGQKGFKRSLYGSYFKSFDTLQTILLGINWYNEPNFIKIPYGEGSLFINTQPLAFTNYHLLYSTYEYASVALSHLPLQKTYWDEYYKPYKVTAQTPLRVILSMPALKAAYTVLILSLIMYIFFLSKRRQRVIPVIQPPANTSLEFLHTISNLHMYQANYKDIALKKYMHFIEYIETKYYLKFEKDDPSFINKLSLKSGIEEKKLERIYNLVSSINKKYVIKIDELVKINTLIEDFYKDCS